MMRTRPHAIKNNCFLAILALLIGLSFMHCSSKKRKRDAGGTGGPAQNPPVEAPPTAGEPVPPVTTKEVTTIETGEEGAVKHLIFESSTNTEEFRHLSEFLLIIRASEDSCVKLKVRPTEGITNETAEEVTTKTGTKSETDSTECDPEQDKADKKEEEEKKEEKKNLHLSAIQFKQGNHFNLAAASAKLCSTRLFRMAIAPGSYPGLGETIGGVANKTGRLVAKTSSGKVRVWLDSEVGNACASGVPTDLKATHFAAINKSSGKVNALTGQSNPLIDQLKISQLQMLANEAEKSLTRLTTAFGDVSDIDSSKAVEIFISPDINRQYFVRTIGTADLDDFRVQYLNKPEDLGVYDANKNPTSNEGEILYMWSPDPAGLYIYNELVSSNSITGNYAKGFLASQMMNLIIHSQRLVAKNPIKPEANWLIESLGYLASNYAAGLDFSRFALGQYLTSRPQYLSLTDGPNKEMGIPDDHHMDDETSGMRAMFGWYLHSKVCSASVVTPCAALKSLITSDLSGGDNVAELLKLTFDKALLNFGASVGVSMTSDSSKSLAFWDTGKEGLPEKPVVLPNPTPISPHNQTEESTFNAAAVIANKNDPSLAGAFPSKNMLLFQPILPDNEMDLQLAKNSVTYIMLTGIIEQSTDMTAVLGKKLSVIIVPLGDRDGTKRRIHTEKVSEYAHMDLRSINLTDEAANPLRTYNKDPEYTSDYTVTNNRELWIMGSIDNITVPSAGGGTKTVADTDSFNIKINPCEGASGTCTAPQYVIAQLIPRDFSEELFPMFFATTTNLEVFAGGNVWNRLQDLDNSYEPPEIVNVKPILCQTFDYGTNNVCGNDGVTAANYASIYCGGNCNVSPYTKDLRVPAFFGSHNRTTDAGGNADKGFLFGYDNFFYAGPTGYPYTNAGTMYWFNSPGRLDNEFYDTEINRQFFTYKYSIDAQPNNYLIYSTTKNAAINKKAVILSDEEITKLVYLKNTMWTGTHDADSPFYSTCSDLGFTNCEIQNDTNRLTLQSEIRSWIDSSDEPKHIVCYNICPASADTEMVQTGALEQKWFNNTATALNLVIVYNENVTATSNRYTTYYQANEPVATDDICSGGRDLSSGTETPAYSLACEIKEDSLLEVDDIRRQFNSSSARVDTKAWGQSYLDYNFLGDPYSWTSYFHSKPGSMGFYVFNYRDSTDRVRGPAAANNTFTMSIEGRRTEVVGKPLKLHPLMFSVPHNTDTIVHFMVGGKEGSSGKYLLRIRVLKAQ